MVASTVFPRPVENNDMDPQTLKCREWIKACCRPAEQLNLKKIIEYKKTKILLQDMFKGM